MRDEDKFAIAMGDVKWWHRFHNKPVWLMALDETYATSAIKPNASQIAKGTVANLYDTDMNIIDTVSNL